MDSVILRNGRNDYLYKVLESWISMELLRKNHQSIKNKSDNVSHVSFPKINFKLIYRASKHGFASSEFHRLCDHKMNTLCLISANDSIFGGYTRIPWESCNDGRAVDQICVNSKSANAFSFFLECNSDVWKQKHSLSKIRHRTRRTRAIVCTITWTTDRCLPIAPALTTMAICVRIF